MITYKISENQFLADIEPFKSEWIQSNTIDHKILPCLGATSLELEKARRNSLLGVPNLPVIIGKCLKYNKDFIRVLGVYENVSDDEIRSYLASDVEYKKIMVTPESYYRVKAIIGERIFKDFFFLFDECDRIIQDVNFRPSVVLPMFDFFRYKQKAFISATVIPPSDPRFKIHKFQNIVLEPDFDYSQLIRLVTTNNILISLKRILHENIRDKYFIFFSSIDGIAEIIQKLNIMDQAAVFCSADGRKKLRLNKFKNVHKELAEYKKYNFFTSRFFSAVDIDYDTFNCDPTIIMITDLVVAPHTMLDPFTESVQIIGRFRRPATGRIKKEVFHISNVDDSLTSMTREESIAHLDEQHAIYNYIKRYDSMATTPEAKQTIEDILKTMPYKKFLYEETGSKNYFMMDNFILEEKIKGYYQSVEKLKKAYEDSGYFVIDRQSVDETYSFSDLDRKQIRSKPPLKSLRSIAESRLRQIYQNKSLTASDIALQVADLQFELPKQLSPVMQLGLNESKKLNFDINKISEKLADDSARKDSFGLRTYVMKHFKPNKSYSGPEIKKILQAGMEQLNIAGIKPSTRYLRKFCKISDRNNRPYLGKDESGKEIRGYRIEAFL